MKESEISLFKQIYAVLIKNTQMQWKYKKTNVCVIIIFIVITLLCLFIGPKAEDTYCGDVYYYINREVTQTVITMILKIHFIVDVILIEMMILIGVI